MRGDEKSASSVEIDLSSTQAFQIGDLNVDPPTLQIESDALSRTIEPRVMQVLVALASARGRVVSRDRLVELCWGGRAVSEDAINRCLAKVRRLGAETNAFEIETVPRVGYRLRDVRSTHRGAIRFSKRWLIIGVLAIAVVAVFIVAQLPRHPNANNEGPKVAVLGFASLNSGTDAQHYADSIATDVSDALVAVGAELQTTPRPTAQSARKAGADFLLSGTVRRESNSIHVTARIDDARNGQTLLGAVFDVPPNDPSVAPDRVAAWAADTIGSWDWILRDERDPDLVAALIRAQGSGRAYPLLRELAQKAPNSGIVQGAFAAMVPFALSVAPQDERREAVAAARVSARRAQTLLPNSGDVYALDCGLNPPGQYIFTSACEDRMQRGLQLDPDAYFLAFAYAAELTEVDRFADADPLSAKALAAAPFNQDRTALRLQILWTLPAHYGSQLELQQREAKAHRQWASPNLIDQVRYQMLLNTGAMDKAEGMLNDPQTSAMIESDAKGPAHLVFRALHSRKPEDIRAASEACGAGPPDLVLGTCLTGLAALGDLDGVFRLAQLSYGDPLCCSPAEVEQKWILSGGQVYPRQYLFGPVMVKARADPRFIEIARRTGLLAYWKSGHRPDFCMTEKVPVCALLGSK